MNDPGRSHKHGSQECLDLAERLSEYLDDELPEDLRHAVKEHIDQCTPCIRFMESLSRVKQLVDLVPQPTLPEDRLLAIAESVKRRLEASS